MRTLGRMMLGLVLLGLVAGWILRPRLVRRRLPLVIALSLLPAVVHAVGITWWAASVGVDAPFVAGYGALCAALLALAWWWMRGAARTRPFLAPVAVPAQAFVQVAVASLLGRAAAAAGAAVDILPGVALLGVTVAIASALVVMLPMREHFPRFGIGAPRWWTALDRTLRRRR